MAATAALANRHIVSTILHHLSDQKYKYRRQYGPDQPVEFLEFRPTLVPSILVNKLWTDEGTSILWKRYPHLPALQAMSHDRRQYYANKVQWVFSLSPSSDDEDMLQYLDGLEWPNLKSLEFEVDFQRHGGKFASMLHSGLVHLELSGFQSGGSKYFTETVLPALLNPCRNLRSLRIGPDTISDDDAIHVSALFDHLDSTPSINTIEVRSTNFVDKDALFARLSQRSGLRSLEIDLDPGFALLPLLSGPSALPTPFFSLKRLAMICYPEVALVLPFHLVSIEELQLDIARIPNQPAHQSDRAILEDLIAELLHCQRLRLLKVGVGLLAEGFPSSSSLPTLSGTSLIKLANTCSKLENIDFYAVEPSAIDGSEISSEEFDSFCRALPHLRSLTLKLNPITASVLCTTALPSLGNHCPDLETVRIKVPLLLSSLPVPDAIPHILVSGDSTPEKEATPMSPVAPGSPIANRSSTSSVSAISFTSAPRSSVFPLFSKLKHLALARPNTALGFASDFLSISSASRSSSIVDPDIEEDLVRSWAHSLLTHFPRLEILEAWGDWAGQDNESLNYFLPIEEILASTWEFLSGVEQDLWEDDEGVVEEQDSRYTLENEGDDWDKASLMNEFEEAEHELGNRSLYEEESEGMITPGRTLDEDPFQDAGNHGSDGRQSLPVLEYST